MLGAAQLKANLATEEVQRSKVDSFDVCGTAKPRETEEK
jgi:hypothetical protein